MTALLRKQDRDARIEPAMSRAPPDHPWLKRPLTPWESRAEAAYRARHLTYDEYRVLLSLAETRRRTGYPYPALSAIGRFDVSRAAIQAALRRAYLLGLLAGWSLTWGRRP